MTIFGLVKLALDELYEEGVAEFEADLDKRILERLEYLSTSYGRLNSPKRKPIDYSDAATRFAYVYRYVAAHGDYIVQVLEMLRNHTGGNVFADDIARISCLGGGPGSDIVGVLKYLSEYEGNEPVKKAICYLLDKEQAWADTWTELDQPLDLDVTLNTNFQRLDVTDPESWASQRKFLKADLFTLSYFISEVYTLDVDGAVSTFLSDVFEAAMPGAIFLYIDNAHSDFSDFFDDIWKKSGRVYT